MLLMNWMGKNVYTPLAQRTQKMDHFSGARLTIVLPGKVAWAVVVVIKCNPTSVSTNIAVSLGRGVWTRRVLAFSRSASECVIISLVLSCISANGMLDFLRGAPGEWP